MKLLRPKMAKADIIARARQGFKVTAHIEERGFGVNVRPGRARVWVAGVEVEVTK